MNPNSENASRATDLLASRLAVKPGKAAEILSVCRDTIYQLISRGDLVSYTEGRARRITTASIEAYVARRLAASRNSKPNGEQAATAA
jgi:excisionase family DNA binding protein